jgi:hypothetical protein
MMIITVQKAASIHNGENTHHNDHVMTLHHFRTANTAASNTGHPNLNTTLLFIFSYLYVVQFFVAIEGPGRRCRRPLPVAASVEKSEDNAKYTLHQRNKSDKRGARTRRCPFAPALIK